MSIPKFVVVFSVIFIFLFSFFVFDGIASSGEDIAASAISQAEYFLVSAYAAVLDAEQAGADVSSLLSQLNEADERLAKAKVAFGLGDFDEAALSADYCSVIGESVKNEADELRVDAYGSTVMDSWLTVIGSLVGVVVVVLGSFWGWRAFKRRYYRRVLTKKPEVVSDES